MTAPASDILRHRAEQATARLPPLLIAAERVASTVAQGAHGRRRAGAGDAFWQFRRYQPGDAPGAVDWRRSARADAVFVRENEWAASQSLYLWRDGSGSMDYRSSPELPSKRERADVLTLALAILATRGGERAAPLGAHVGAGVPAMAGSFAVERLTEILLRPAAESGFRLDGPPPPRFAQAVLIGDFLDAADRMDGPMEASLRGMSERGVRGCLLQVLDPAEEDLPFSGRVRLSGLEGEAPLLVPRIEELREPYRRRLADRRDHLRTLARALGWTFMTHRTDRSPHAALLGLWAALAGRGELAPPASERRAP
jgi:uncharacterized protein (DUF58 family)